jgi:hypothetical protein
MTEGRESEVLIRQLDRHLSGLRRDRNPAEVELAELLTAALRRLVTETAVASAADRAQVRAAVHYVVRRRANRPVSGDVRVVNDILRRLGRADLVVRRTPEPA